MKKIILFFAICFLLSNIQAQIISSELITSNGDFYSNSTAMLSFAEGVVIDDFNLQSVNSINDTKTVSNSFKIYPNPATNTITLNIDNTNNTELSLSIYSVMGTLAKSEILKQNNQQINIVDISNGVYIVTIKSKDFTGNQKLIIQR